MLNEEMIEDVSQGSYVGIMLVIVIILNVLGILC